MVCILGKDIGMGIHKVLWCPSYVPCLVALRDFIPICLNFYVFCDFFRLLFFGGEGGGGRKYGLRHCSL